MKDYIIKIAKPCAEDWYKMTQAEKGRFCAVCEKEVVDFSSSTREEVIQHLNQSKNVCGRVPTAFLTQNEKNYPSGLRLNGIVATAINLLVLTTVTTATAQKKTEKKQQPEIVAISNETFMGDVGVIRVLEPETRIISGVVINAKEGYPLANTSITISNNDIEVKTGIDGKFSMEIPVDSEKIILHISHADMNDTDIVVEELKTYYRIMMQEQEHILAGGITIKRKKKWLFF